MSRAFVKEDVQIEELPDRLISEHPNYVTAAGLALIDEALEAARHDFAKARGTGERSAMAAASRELRYWSARRASAEVIAPPSDDALVQFGSSVTIVRDDGRRQSFRIVGEDEANPAEGSVSYVSPLGRSLIGRAEGDTVRAGRDDAEIVMIKV